MSIIGYIRVSGASQVDAGGPDRQRQAIASFCHVHGLTLDECAEEMAVSGTVEGMDRPTLRAIIDRLSSGAPDKIAAIVVERLDRLARDLMVQELFLRECRTRGIAVYTADSGQAVDQATDGGDPTRKLIRQIMGALAEWEKSVIVKKLKAGRDRKRALTGKPCGGNQIFGTRVGEADTLEAMLELRGLGVSYRCIAETLNNSQLPTRSGRPWTKGAVESVLSTAEAKKKGATP